MSTQHVSLFSGTGSGGDVLVAWAESTRWRRVVMSCRGGLRFAFYGRVSTEDYPKYGARLPPKAGETRADQADLAHWPRPAAVAERDRINPLADQPSQGRGASEREESGHGGPEFTQDGRRSGRILEHPSVAEPVEDDRLGAGSFSGLGRRGSGPARGPGWPSRYALGSWCG